MGRHYPTLGRLYPTLGRLYPTLGRRYPTLGRRYPTLGCHAAAVLVALNTHHSLPWPIIINVIFTASKITNTIHITA
jgi:hypothetical protein